MKQGIFTIKVWIPGTTINGGYPFECKCETAVKVLGAYIAFRENVIRHSINETEMDDFLEKILRLKSNPKETVLCDCDTVFVRYDPIGDDESSPSLPPNATT